MQPLARNAKRSNPRRVTALGVVVLMASTMLVLAASAAHASIKISHKTIIDVQEQPTENWNYDATTGTALDQDPSCPNFPGVHRNAKVWADAYVDTGSGSLLYANLRMYFYTTYKTNVATAKQAIKDTQNGRDATCQELYAVGNNTKITDVKALSGAACGSASVNKPTRWCSIASSFPSDPVLDMHMNDTCRTPQFGGNYGIPYWHEWHNVKDRTDAHLFDSSQFGLTVPIYLDDIMFIGGVANFNHDKGQPDWEPKGYTGWVGYGRVQTAADSTANVNSFDTLAQALGKAPLNPATTASAHSAAWSAIKSNTAVTIAGQHVRAGDWYNAQKKNWCLSSPKVGDVVDPGTTSPSSVLDFANNSKVPTLIAMQEGISDFVKKETGASLCRNLQNSFSSIAPQACRYGATTAFIANPDPTYKTTAYPDGVPGIDNGECMNAQNPTANPPDPYEGIVANAMNIRLGCNRDAHIANFFKLLKLILSGSNSPPPAITNIDPLVAYPCGGAPINIYGHNFELSDDVPITVAYLGKGVDPNPIVYSSGQLISHAPALPVGTSVQLQVSGVNGISTRSSQSVVYQPAPPITVGPIGNTLQIGNGPCGTPPGTTNVTVTEYLGYLIVQSDPSAGPLIAPPGWTYNAANNSVSGPRGDITQMQIITPPPAGKTSNITINTPDVATYVDNRSGAGATDVSVISTSRVINIFGGSGNDSVTLGDTPNASADGGGGFNSISYANTNNYTTVWLPNAGTASSGSGPNGANDTLRNFDAAFAGPGGATLVGNNNPNSLVGGNGNDWLIPGTGSRPATPSYVLGGAGTDTVSYQWRTTPVSATLGWPGAGGAFNWSANNGEAGQNDYLGSDIEGLYGGSSNDTLNGNPQWNVITGAGGADTMNGFGGGDWVVYQDGRTCGVAVVLPEPNVWSAPNNGCAGENDTLGNFDNIWGSSQPDYLVGNSHSNVLRGDGGSDVLAGNGGVDTVDYADNAHTACTVVVVLGQGGNNGTGGCSGESDSLTVNLFNVVGGYQKNIVFGNEWPNVIDLRISTGSNVVAAGPGDDTVYAGNYGDQIEGDAGNDVLLGGNGNDSLYGDAGPSARQAANGIYELPGNTGYGRDTVYGYGGYDNLDVADGQQDVFACGAGGGHATIDLSQYGFDVYPNTPPDNDCQLTIVGWERPIDYVGTFDNGQGVASNGNGIMHVMYTDGTRIYYRFFNGFSWTGDTDTNIQATGGNASGPPALGFFNGGGLVAAARSTTGQIYLEFFGCGGAGAGACVGNWPSIGAPPVGAIGAPTVSGFGPGNNAFAVFVQGGDRAMWFRAYNGSSWGPWQSAGGGIAMNNDGLGSGAAPVWMGAPGRVLFFVRGTNNHLYQNELQCALGCGTTGYIDLGPLTAACGCFDGTPSAVTNGGGWIQLFSADSSRFIQERVWVPGIGWYTNILVGGLASADPTAASSSYATVQLFTSRGRNNDMSQYRFDPRP